MPSPWETVFNRPSNRDVGSVTEHPIWEKFELEVFPDSLETAQEQDGFPPTIAMGRVLIKDNKKPTMPPPTYRMTGVGGEEVGLRVEADQGCDCRAARNLPWWPGEQLQERVRSAGRSRGRQLRDQPAEHPRLAADGHLTGGRAGERVRAGRRLCMTETARA